MDSIFGIVGKDFVLLAADCKVARSILVYKDDEDKVRSCIHVLCGLSLSTLDSRSPVLLCIVQMTCSITTFFHILCNMPFVRMALIVYALLYQSMNLDDHKVMVTSGPQSDRLAFSEYIQKNMKLYELRNGVTLNGPATANYVRGELARFLRRAPYQVNLLLGAVDASPEQSSEPSLYWIDYFGSMVKVNFGAHGYGAHFCLSIFDREWKPDMSLDEAKDVLRKCRAELDQRFLVRNGQWAYTVSD